MAVPARRWSGKAGKMVVAGASKVNKTSIVITWNPWICSTLMQSHAGLQWTKKFCLAGDACGFFAFACVHWSFAKQLGAYHRQCTDTSSLRHGKKLQMQKLTSRGDEREEHSCWGTVRNNQPLICKVAGPGTQRGECSSCLEEKKKVTESIKNLQCVGFIGLHVS